MKATLKDGFEVEINENCLDDWQFLTILRKIDKGDAGMIVDVAEAMLGGEEQVNKLAEHLKVDGKTRIDDMVNAITEIMESANELKNL